MACLCFSGIAQEVATGWWCRQWQIDQRWWSVHSKV